MITWVIEQLWVKPSEGSLTDVVVTAAWRCNGEQVSGGKTYSGTCYGTASFVAPDPSQFIPYSNLTQAEVLGWVWASGIDKANTETSVNEQIQNQINPPIIVPPLPWNSNS
jgi:hypothetical protein